MVSGEEIARLGQQIYDDQIRQAVEPRLNGQFLVIDIATGDYEVDPDEMAAGDRLYQRHPNGDQFLIRVGHPTAHRIGIGAMRS